MRILITQPRAGADAKSLETWNGRPGSNWRRSAWEAVVYPSANGESRSYSGQSGLEWGTVVAN